MPGDTTERIRKVAAEETEKGERRMLDVARPWASAVVSVIAVLVPVIVFLVTRASAGDVDRLSARVVVLEAAHTFDVERMKWLMEQMTEIAHATRARLVPQPPEPLSTTAPTEEPPPLPRLPTPKLGR